MAAALALGLTLVPALPAGAEVPDPTQWPTGAGTDPGIETTAHTIRFAGPDRYQTNLATALALRGRGDFPFDTPDLAEAGDWWGAATCPYAVLLVAGDTFADALAAASLSDPTNQSNEPRVQRVAAADPLFDPVGGFDRVDTDGAPIIVTASGRSGATSLSPAARISLNDLANGGCTTAREAIVIGGEAAIPSTMASELVSLGYDEVFRVAGLDRYETAARVAIALGTEAPTSTTCVDPEGASVVRLGFYGNANIEYRPSSDVCHVVSRSVVLADGGTGADALAAGWWTSFWQVPILLTAPDGSLPTATRTALQTLDIDNLIVLGGTGRIPESTVEEAADLASALYGRFAGVDRYATSVEMARFFGGWHGEYGETGGRASMVCLAGSSGSGAEAKGWPDALAAGPWCGRAGGAAANPGAPVRALPAVASRYSSAHVVGDRQPARDAVPILLAPVGAPALPQSTQSFLQATFGEGTVWCNGDAAPDTCVEPGFGVVFGGTGTVDAAAEGQLAKLVSGDTYQQTGDVRPQPPSVFATRLDLSPIFVAAEAGSAQICAPRGALVDLRWLLASAEATAPAVADLAADGRYRLDADGVVRTEGQSVPLCIGAPGTEVDVTGISLSGHRAVAPPITVSDERRLSLSRAVVQEGEEPSSPDSGTRVWGFRAPPSSSTSVAIAGRTAEVRAATLDLTLREMPGAAPDEVEGVAVLDTSLGRFVGAVAGEARFDGRFWRFRGQVTVDGGFAGAGPLSGGFHADLDTGAAAGDTVAWLIDAFPAAG